MKVIAYHGTSADFDEAEGLRESKVGGRYADLNVPHDGIWFSSSPEDAKKFAMQRRGRGRPRIIRAELDIRNPRVMDIQDYVDEGLEACPDLFYVREGGHDVLVIPRGDYDEPYPSLHILEKPTWYAVVDPSIIRVLDVTPLDMEPNGDRGDVGMKRVVDEFNAAFDVVEERFPDVGTIELHEDERAGSDNGAGSERQFAYCKDGNPIVIAFAPKSARQDPKRLRGLMRHELGHALEYRYGVKELERRLGKLPAEVERRADAIAERVFGQPIVYDADLVQCVGRRGTSPRPAHLPDKKEKLKANGRVRANPPPGKTFTAFHASLGGMRKPEEFREFKSMDFGPGFYLGTDPRDLSSYGPQLYEAEVRLENPIIISREVPPDPELLSWLQRALSIKSEDISEEFYANPLLGVFDLAKLLVEMGQISTKKLVAALQKRGYDGIYVDGDVVNAHHPSLSKLHGDYLIVWEPDQLLDWKHVGQT